jgi:4-amino-4-deoxy-L-arabinose transferase-like glycosyltransferase
VRHVRRIPRAARAAALVALLNAIVWSLLVPPLQSFDEPVHVYYGQFLAETYNVPRPVQGSVLSAEEVAILNSVRLFDVVGNPDGAPPWTEVEDNALDDALGSGLGRVSQGADGGVGAYPPFYYGLGALAYLATPSSNLLDRLEAMRLVSALLAAVTALFVCLFVRELLPGRPYASTAAGLVAAFQPLFGFMSGVFNPDIGMAAASAVLFFGIARAWRHGLTWQLGLVIGLALAAGFLSKLAMAAIVPGAVLSVLLLAWRWRAWRPILTFGAGAGAPVLVYMLLNRFLWDRPALLGGGAPASNAVSPPKSNLPEMFSFVWQSYLPRLPFMRDQFDYDFPLWDRYFVGWVGRFGWGDYQFPLWVSQVTLGILVVLLVAAIVFAFGRRRELLARWPEGLSYAAIAGGLLFLLAYTGYGWKRDTGTDFEQGRYLLPLLALYAGLVAAGLRGLGDRIGPVVAGGLVTLAIAHSMWAQILTVVRFYT